MKKLPVAINENEFTNLIKHTKSEKHKLAFLLGYGSGLRVSEVINLKPENIENNTIRILRWFRFSFYVS